MDGMVAVVRGVGDAGLSVTLHDGQRQYTLMPSAAAACPGPPPRCPREHPAATRSCRDSASQATDGQYATVYQMSHCSVAPTSPCELLTEYPPQRRGVRPGDDNLVVGSGVLAGGRSPIGSRALGSTANDAFYGSPPRERSSHGFNSFARSLRRPLPPEPSYEVLERLDTHSPDKHGSLSRSPSRQPQFGTSSWRISRSSTAHQPKYRDDEPTRDGPGGHDRSCNVRRVESLKGEKCRRAPKSATVTSETQASVQTMSREVETAPRMEPLKRNVAIPLSPQASRNPQDATRCDAVVSGLQQNVTKQTLKKSRRTPTGVHQQQALNTVFRKCKSLGDVAVKRDIYKDILDLLKEIVAYSKFGDILFKDSKKQSNFSKSRRHDMDKHRMIRRTASFNLDSLSLDNVLTVESRTNNCSKKSPAIDKTELLTQSLMELLHLNDNNMKRKTFRLIDYMFDNLNDGGPSLNELASFCLNRLQNLFTLATLNKDTTETKEIISEVIKKSLIKFTQKNKLKLKTANLEDMTSKLINICKNNNVDTKNKVEIEIMALMMKNDFTNNQAAEYTDQLIKQTCEKVFEGPPPMYPRNYVVFQNTQNSIQGLNESDNFSVAPINERDIDINLKFYKNQLVQAVEQWLTSVTGTGLSEIFRQVAVNDLTDDIIDRHKYLEMNPSKRKSDEDELEYLKFQIFKWIHELVGDDKISNALDHADVLSQTIRSIPVPMLTLSQNPGNLKSSLPPCCTAQPTSHAGPSLSTPKNYTPALSHSFGTDQSSNYAPAPSYPAQNRNPPKYRRQSSPTAFASGPMIHNAGSVGRMPIYAQAIPGGRLDYVQNIPHNMRRMSGSSNYASGTFVQNQLTDLSYNQISSLSPKGLGGNVIQNPVNNNLWEGRRMLGNFPASGESWPSNYNQTFASRPRSASFNQQPTQRQSPSRRRMSGPATFASGPMNLYPLPDQMQQNMYPNFSNSHDGAQYRNACCNITNASPNLPLAQIEDEFEQFVQNWVKQIPISSSNPQEQAIGDKARLGIFNGIMIAVSKLKLEPTKFNNPVYCQDVLEDEIDGLLSCLPQTEELTKAMQTLKPQLLDKANNMIAQAARNSSSYKQQLVHSITNHIPLMTIDMQAEDPERLYDDMLKMAIADNFILFTKYNEEDKFQANMFKKKVANRVNELVENIKNTHGFALYNLDFDRIKDEVMNALTRVPLPTDDEMKDEVDEVLLGMDIDHWFSDLPLVQSEDNYECVQQRRLRDLLTKKIHDIEKRPNTSEEAIDLEIKQETLRVLQKLHLRVETAELQFMAGELLNRLKNRNKAGFMTQRKSVAFQDPQGYDHFAQNMAYCSSYADANQDQSSYMIVGGDRHDSPYQQNIPYVNERREVTPEQWFTLEETKAPPGLRDYQSIQATSQFPSCCQQTASGAGQQELNQQSQVQTTPSSNIQRSHQLPPHYQQMSQVVPQHTQHNTLQQSAIDYLQPPPQLNNSQIYQQQPPPCCQVLEAPGTQSSHVYPQSPKQGEMFMQPCQIPGPSNVTQRGYVASTPQHDASASNFQKQFVSVSPNFSINQQPNQATPVLNSSQIAGPSNQDMYSVSKRSIKLKPGQLGTPEDVLVTIQTGPKTESQVPPETPDIPEADDIPEEVEQAVNDQAYITPQSKEIQPKYPPLKKKPTRVIDRQKIASLRRRLDLEDPEEVEEQEEYRCRCLERVFSGKRRMRACYDMEDFPMEMHRCMPFRFYPCFY
ncbi:uncharacterized protein LOC101736358 [Bombyx mori]|uniref:Uncharacterized protein n=1 Tax=Bombyx mori TaxID=7091 RepID=A0A8R2HR86_BOMMO|nr:uncharacterized protein LOC101736358 isoform X1 [Bombyx mori]XP_021204044.1 uncharacterized protein LOC101736358 isoform X1 [Bombyx mori]XP_021204045.1 uncharacterized protein LOC101736358 isoform X1 [Bombyx mori]XP_021204046.1 uncharacterized protein LOC101736358 isoform X1 [Bombyx mori]XP_037871570.1 uncharacterized protein LOC101736358 isoform X1 [Bombyx mori]